jgi:hypothetical protein
LEHDSINFRFLEGMRSRAAQVMKKKLKVSIISACKSGPAGEIPVKIISLKDQLGSRLDLIKNGIPAEWIETYFEATDLRSRTLEALEGEAYIPQIEKKIGRALLPAEIGCAMSHRSASCWLADSKYALALVLEDDVIPQVPDWVEQVTATAAALLTHAERGAAFICHLGARQNQADAALKQCVKWKRSWPKAAPDLFVFTDPERSLWRSHAYLISHAAALRGCRTESKIQTLADDWCERRRRGLIDEIFFTRPILIGQDESRPSNICLHGERNKKPLMPSRYKSTRSRANRIIAVVRSHFPYRLP